MGSVQQQLHHIRDMCSTVCTVYAAMLQAPGLGQTNELGVYDNIDAIKWKWGMTIERKPFDELYYGSVISEDYSSPPPAPPPPRATETNPHQGWPLAGAWLHDASQRGGCWPLIMLDVKVRVLVGFTA